MAGQLPPDDQKRLAYSLVGTRHRSYSAAQAAERILRQAPWDLEELERFLDVAGDGDDGSHGEHGLWDYPDWGGQQSHGARSWPWGMDAFVTQLRRLHRTS